MSDVDDHTIGAHKRWRKSRHMFTQATGDSGSGYEAVVCTEWEATYADPLTGRVGEGIEATDRMEDWHATSGWTWRWCRDGRGREGWVPEALLVVNGTVAILREDYDAHEMTVLVGARVTVVRELAGWARCHTADGASGWVPLECLSRLLS
jgi:hypothetical protein